MTAGKTLSGPGKFWMVGVVDGAVSDVFWGAGLLVIAGE
ncbi:hypothetical protein imdm_364 [gamma proteobacterium IMCC2047]|nr:hypothetical protein imdm_364 [gamma proteobacterium IMCC2047]